MCARIVSLQLTPESVSWEELLGGTWACSFHVFCSYLGQQGKRNNNLLGKGFFNLCETDIVQATLSLTMKNLFPVTADM